MALSNKNIGVVAELESKLPVKIKKDIEEKSPQFLQLLNKVAEKLDKSGRSQAKIPGIVNQTRNFKRSYIQV